MESTNNPIFEYKKTIPQLIRESSKTGNYEFIILQKTKVNSKNTCNHVVQRINGNIFGHIELSKKLSDCIKRGDKCYDLKKERLLEFFNGYIPQITIMERVINCLGDKKEKYKRVLQLIFDNTDYGNYDILDEFIESLRTSKNNIRKIGKNTIKQKLLNYLKNNYLNKNFIDLYNEFCEIMEKNKNKLIGGDNKANEFFNEKEGQENGYNEKKPVRKDIIKNIQNNYIDIEIVLGEQLPKSKIIEQQKAEDSKKLNEEKLAKQTRKIEEQKEKIPTDNYQKKLQEQQKRRNQQKNGRMYTEI